MATPQLHRQWVLLGGWKTLVPMECSTHIPGAQGCTQWPRWVTALFGSAGLWLQGSLWGAPCGCKASMAPAATPPPHWGCPRSLTCLVCFAALGWSHYRPLGHLSPPTPSLMLLDQVGPWATIPCLPATPIPQEWASQSHCHHCCGTGCCLARSSSAPTCCNMEEPILGHLFRGKPALPALQGGTGTPISFLMASCSPQPITWTDTTRPLESPQLWHLHPPSFGAGNEEEPKSPPHLRIVNASC